MNKSKDAMLSLEEFEKMKIVQYDDIPISKLLSCPECGRSNMFPIPFIEKKPNLIGWCDTAYGFMGVFECPFCFAKFRFHVSIGAVGIMTDFILILL